MVAPRREVVAPRRLGHRRLLIASGVIAAAMLVYSYLNFRDIRDDEAREDQRV